jgi:hypothetical protein
MGNNRTFVTFESSLPSDAVFAESGDVDVSPGRNICEKLIADIRCEGIVVSEPVQREFYGWEFTVQLEENIVWILLQWVEPWLLIIENRGDKSGWFRKAREPSDHSLTFINDVLNKAGVFSGILWFARSEFEAGSPVGSAAP